MDLKPINPSQDNVVSSPLPKRRHQDEQGDGEDGDDSAATNPRHDCGRDDPELEYEPTEPGNTIEDNNEFDLVAGDPDDEDGTRRETAEIDVVDKVVELKAYSKAGGALHMQSVRGFKITCHHQISSSTLGKGHKGALCDAFTVPGLLSRMRQGKVQGRRPFPCERARQRQRWCDHNISGLSGFERGIKSAPKGY